MTVLWVSTGYVWDVHDHVFLRNGQQCESVNDTTAVSQTLRIGTCPLLTVLKQTG